MKYYIYIIQNIVNNKIYVGQSVQPKTRWSQHKYDAKSNISKSNYLYNSINKYGIDNFNFTIIEEYDSIESVNEAECFWIDFFQSQNRGLGLNIRNGGSNGPHSEESKLKVSISKIGSHHTDETKQKMSMAKIGKHLSKETKQKMSIAQSGEKHAQYGKHRSEETKRKISEANKGKKYSLKNKITQGVG